jgi:hypothetical protein
MRVVGGSRLQLAGYTRRATMLSQGDESYLLLTPAVTSNYFSLLGVRAALGQASVDEIAGHPAVVLGHRFWRSRAGGDPEIVGKTLILDKKPFQVAGVMRAEFNGTRRGVAADVWVSTSDWFGVRTSQ